MKFKFYKYLLLFFVIGSILSCKKDIPSDQSLLNRVSEYDAQSIQEWNNLFLEIERYAAGYRPCPTASSLGYWNLAIYEATVEGMPSYRSISNNFPNLSIPPVFEGLDYHYPTVVNAVSNYFFTRLFPESSPELFYRVKLLNDKNEELYQENVSQEVYNRSKNHGVGVAEAVWNWMKTDPYVWEQYKDPFTSYDWESYFDGDGDWVPTSPGPGAGLFPYYGKVRTFAIKENMKLCRPFDTYAPFSQDHTSGFYAQALEVMAQNTPSLSFQTEWVGEFWSDDLLDLTFSPPARWIAIANQVYQNEKASLEEAIVANAKVGLALHDAAVGCWNSKYFYNLERPATYINRNIDPTWKPNLDNPLTGDEGISPSFPAYPSGHSTFGAAAAEALASVFGYSYSMTDNCHRDRNEFLGFPRTFSSFYEMAYENAWSRIPLGVHYRMDAEEGMRYGTEIGRVVNNLNWKK